MLLQVKSLSQLCDDGLVQQEEEVIMIEDLSQDEVKPRKQEDGVGRSGRALGLGCVTN
jgi:hypothetical protein